MASYHPIRDITTGTSKHVDDVDPSLVVSNVENTRSFMPLIPNSIKPAYAATVAIAAEELLKTRERLSIKQSLKLLEETGWGNGTRLPFANKENNELEKILEIKQRKYLMVQTELRDNVDHLLMLEQNFARANDDITNYNNFLTSRKKQIEEERNLVFLADRFHSRVLHDTKTTKKALKECRERCERMKVDHERRLKNLTELRDLIEFDREALQEYHDRLTNYQNQKIELGRIIQEDSKTVEQIDNAFVELGAKRKTLRRELDIQAMNSAKAQEQLDRLSVEFRKVYKHRLEMITLWSTNIENAKRKDAQMADVADDYFELRERLREVLNELDFRDRQYRNVQCGISRAQIHISELDKKVTDIRRNLRQLKIFAIQFNDSIRELQQDIRAISIEQKNLIAKNVKVDEDLQAQHEILAKVKAAVEKLREKLIEVTSMRYHSDQNINELEKILSDEEKRADDVLREMEFVRKYYWERSNDKKTVISDLLHTDMQIHRVKGSLANMESRQYTNMEFLARQSAKVYRLDLESSTLENKLGRVDNEAVNPQFYIIQNELSMLREIWKKADDEKRYLHKEVSFLDTLTLKVKAELGKNKDDKEKLGTELLQINMASQRTQKLIDNSDKKLQDMQVENSLETVNYKRLNDAIKMAKEQLFGLSEERKTIVAAVNERKVEIETNKGLNMNKSKALSESVGKLKVQIQDMTGRTHKLKGRFDLVTKLMMGSQHMENDDTLGNRVRQAARERESLQQELRKWEARVEEAKQEIVGLENVLQMLHASNLAVKDKLMPITEDSTESNELDILEQEEKAIHVRKNKATQFKVVLYDKVEDLKQQIAVMDQETHATAQLCKTKGQMASKIENELHKQKEKVQRWSSLCCKLLKEVRPIISKSGYDHDHLQKDLRLRFVQEKLDCGINMLDRLIAAFPDRKQMILEYFEGHEHLFSLLYRLLKPVVGSTSFGLRALSTIAPKRSIHYEDDMSITSSSASKSRQKSTSLSNDDLPDSDKTTESEPFDLPEERKRPSIHAARLSVRYFQDGEEEEQH